MDILERAKYDKNQSSNHHAKQRFADLVSDLTMTIQDGEKVAIIGEEGNGKSTYYEL